MAGQLKQQCAGCAVSIMVGIGVTQLGPHEQQACKASNCAVDSTAFDHTNTEIGLHEQACSVQQTVRCHALDTSHITVQL